LTETDTELPIGARLIENQGRNDARKSRVPLAVVTTSAASNQVLALATGPSWRASSGNPSLRCAFCARERASCLTQTLHRTNNPVHPKALSTVKAVSHVLA
jgi:hypothetical protein